MACGKNIEGKITISIDNFKAIKQILIFAEIGVNHEGNFSLAKDLIDMAKEAGADGVKFQTFKKDEYVAINQRDRFERIQKFHLTFDQFRKLADYAKCKDIIFFSTPFDFDSVDFLYDIVPFYKVSSGDLTNLFLVEKIALKKKPIILSTGLATEKEIKQALSVIRNKSPHLFEQGKILLMHCVSAYPTPLEEANLSSIPFLKEMFNLPIGYSDHTIGTKACEAAAALGAKVIEKHFTYRKENQSFHDHHLSADPKDFKDLVNNIRTIEKMLGVYGKKILNCEDIFATNMRRSLGAKCPIKKGSIITNEKITFLRPALGIRLEDLKLIIGKKSKRDIPKGELIQYADIDE